MKIYKVSEILNPVKNSIVLEPETKYKLLGLTQVVHNNL